MKHLAITAFGLLFSCSAFAQQVVTGTLTGAEGKKLYLYSDEDNNPKDSVLLKDGKFSFKVVAGSGPAINAIILEDVGNPLLFVTDKEPAQYMLKAETFPIATSMKGSEDNKAMQAYQKSFQGLIKQAQALNTEASTINGTDEAAKDAFRKKAAAFNEEVMNTGKEFIKMHPKQLASLWILVNELSKRVEPGEFEQLFNSLDQPLKETKYGISASKYIRSLKEVSEGEMAEDFSQADMNGNPVKLSSFRGKYVLVDFWASWCGPCRAENPNVVKAFNRFKDKNFTIVGVSLDNNRDRWVAAVKQDNLQWTQLSDLKGWSNEVAQQYNVRAIPANFLIDPKGRIIGRNLRGGDLEAKLEKVLK
ncbi:MAG TPA: TlpA disulfide reductase family protein [Chitinophaga sp.]|nr:TlpA disulfide reductase family protein [Chitinophaga sp.]